MLYSLYPHCLRTLRARRRVPSGSRPSTRTGTQGRRPAITGVDTLPRSTMMTTQTQTAQTLTTTRTSRTLARVAKSLKTRRKLLKSILCLSPRPPPSLLWLSNNTRHLVPTIASSRRKHASHLLHYNTQHSKYYTTMYLGYLSIGSPCS